MQQITSLVIAIACCLALVQMLIEYCGHRIVMAGFTLVLARALWSWACWMHKYATKVTADGTPMQVVDVHEGREYLECAADEAIINNRVESAEEFGGIFFSRPSFLQYLDNILSFYLPDPPGDQVVVSDSTAILNILGGDVGIFGKWHRLKTPETSNRQNMSQHSLANSQDKNTWKRQRQAIINACFSMYGLEMAVASSHSVAVGTVHQLAHKLPQDKKKSTVDISEWVDQVALDSAMFCSLGRQTNQSPRNPLTQSGATLRFQRLFTEYWVVSRRQYHRLAEFKDHPPSEAKRETRLQLLAEEMRIIVKQQEKNLKRRPDSFMTTMCRPSTQDQLTPIEVMDNVFDFMIHGFETTSQTLAMCVLCLANDQDAQLKVREDIEYGGIDYKNKEMRMIVSQWNSESEDPSKPPRQRYLGKVIKEVLRLYPPVMQCVRSTQEDVSVHASTRSVPSCPAGAKVELHCKKDTTLFCNLVAANRDTAIWGPDAHEFIPERWDEDRLTAEQKKAFLSFGGGMRGCPAAHFAEAHMEIALEEFVKVFQVHTVEGESGPKFKQGPTLQISGGLNLELERLVMPRSPQAGCLKPRAANGSKSPPSPKPLSQADREEEEEEEEEPQMVIRDRTWSTPKGELPHKNPWRSFRAPTIPEGSQYLATSDSSYESPDSYESDSSS